MIPLTKFETISWRPKPSPTPSAARTTPIRSIPRWIAERPASRPTASTTYRQSVTTANRMPGSSVIRGKTTTVKKVFR